MPKLRVQPGKAVRRSFRLAALFCAGRWFQVFSFKSFEQVMTISKAAQVTQASIRHSRFRIVCINCDSLGIVFDCPEGAPPSTQIKCRHCGAPRGTLGELRELSCSDRRDLFEV